MIKKMKVLTASLLVLLSLFTATLTTTVHASETEDTNIPKVTAEERTVDILEQEGYLEVDSLNQSISITDKYKQKVLENIDTNVYNVNFTENSVEIAPKIQARSFSGVTKIVYTWKGYDLYLSSGDANRVAAGLGIGATVAALIPEPVASKVVTVALGVAAGLIAYNNADGRGVIIAFIGAPGQNSAPHWITSQ